MLEDEKEVNADSLAKSGIFFLNPCLQKITATSSLIDQIFTLPNIKFIPNFFFFFGNFL